MKTKGWFVKLSPVARQEYLRKHPKSKLRKSSVTSKAKPATKLKFKQRPKVSVVSDEGGDEGIF